MITRTPALLYASGSFGALTSLGLLSFLGGAGFHRALGVTLNPGFFNADFLCPRLVAGGVLAWVFLFPLPFRYSLFGIPFMAAPVALFQLFFTLPQWEHAGWLGIRYGWATPFLVIGYTLLWAMVTSFAMRLNGGR
jgi:hypothetical protein